MGGGETHGFTLLSVTDGMFLVLREANRKVSTWRCCMNSAVFLRTAEARCYLGRGSLLCSGQGCRSCRRCRRATGPPSSRTWARLVPTSPRWTLGHTHKRTHTYRTLQLWRFETPKHHKWPTTAGGTFNCHLQNFKVHQHVRVTIATTFTLKVGVSVYYHTFDNKNIIQIALLLSLSFFFRPLGQECHNQFNSERKWRTDAFPVNSFVCLTPPSHLQFGPHKALS